MQYMGFALFGAGDTIFKQGDTGEHFYIILSGAVAVSVFIDEDTKVRQFKNRLTCSSVQTPSTISLWHVKLQSTSTALMPSSVRCEF